jgi:serine/threonine protein phosphatase PrpC
MKGLTVEPFIKRVELRIINKFVVIASDGVWDVI